MQEYAPTTTRPNGSATTFLAGADLRHALWGKSAKERAQIAAHLVDKSVTLGGLTAAQASRLCGVSQCDVTAARGRAGSHGARDKTVERLAKKYGAETLTRALDRATAPQCVAAE